MDRLSDIVGQDLAGYELVVAHRWYLNQLVAARIVAIIRSSNDEIICVDDSLVADILRLLPDRDKTRMVSSQFLYCRATGDGFLLDHSEGFHTPQQRVLTRERFNLLRAKDDLPFEWVVR